VNLGAFKMAKYETSYELWKEVYDWAVNNGYTFQNAGLEGHGTNGTGTEPNEAIRKTRPVTEVSWRDAVVWCNAYSELAGKEPVYYSCGAALMDSRNANAATFNAAQMNTTKNGYRLPTEAEWEYAARGGNQGDTINWNYTYAGTSGNILGPLRNYAWYRFNAASAGSGDPDYGAHPVGTKTANGADLHDMSGNVWEWCWDWYNGIITGSTPADGAALGTKRVVRGGNWYSNDSNCAVAYRNSA
jgi:formylglycine-generating enzyme required for sulfatase activity